MKKRECVCVCEKELIELAKGYYARNILFILQ